ncbi:MAG: DUF2520 domain-containing protein [Acidobacteria bacterium]|nr:DUF2520 domain-containing protein [Acidobacteriota bacterium]
MSFVSQEAIGIAGAGRMAQALGRLLYQKGEPVVAVASRSYHRAKAASAFIGPAVEPLVYVQLPSRARRVLIAVPDDAVTAVAQTLVEGGMKDGAVIHTCGARGLEAVAPLADQGISCAALHPLQTIASPEQGVTTLPGCAFALTGTGEAAAWGAHIIALLGGQTLSIQSRNKPMYHAAAVMASNYIVALIEAATMLMRAGGIEREQALRALAPMIRASADNALCLGPLNALTGPIQRGDIQTVAAHLEALRAVPLPGAVLQLYRAAGLQTLELAKERGLSAALATELENLLKGGNN